MGNSTISMVIFNSYVKSPEGNHRAAATSAMCHNVKLGFIQRLNLGEQKLENRQRTNGSVAKTDGARNPAFNMSIFTIR